jgi:hypothetical protein
MKVLVKESRRDQLAIKELDKAFSDMYEDVNYQTDSTGEQKIIHYRNGDGVIMLYGDRNKALYISEDIRIMGGMRIQDMVLIKKMLISMVTLFFSSMMLTLTFIMVVMQMLVRKMNSLRVMVIYIIINVLYF